MEFEGNIAIDIKNAKFFYKIKTDCVSLKYSYNYLNDTINILDGVRCNTYMLHNTKISYKADSDSNILYLICCYPINALNAVTKVKALEANCFTDVNSIAERCSEYEVLNWFYKIEYPHITTKINNEDLDNQYCINKKYGIEFCNREQDPKTYGCIKEMNISKTSLIYGDLGMLLYDAIWIIQKITKEEANKKMRNIKNAFEDDMRYMNENSLDLYDTPNMNFAEIIATNPIVKYSCFKFITSDSEEGLKKLCDDFTNECKKFKVGEYQTIKNANQVKVLSKIKNSTFDMNCSFIGTLQLPFVSYITQGSNLFYKDLMSSPIGVLLL